MPAPRTAITGLLRCLGGRRSSGEQGGVDAAGQRLDEDGALVRHVVGDAVQLRLVGHELARPAAAGRAAEPDLDARVEVTGDEVGVVVAIAGRGVLERQGNARAAWPSTGSSTTRVPSSSSPTTSWPGTNGKLTQSSKYVDACPSIIERSEPQIPASAVWTRCQPGPGSSGGSIVAYSSGPTRTAAAGATAEHPSQPEPGTCASLQRLHGVSSLSEC